MKEITSAEKSTLFKAYYDKTGIVNPEEPGVLYLVSRAHPESPYGNQQHVWSVKFTYGRGDYQYVFPTHPPLVRCETPIHHPNISCGGAICLDVLSSIDPSSQASLPPDQRKNGWQMTYSIEAVFVSIQALLDDPNTGSPFNADANRDYITYHKATGKTSEETIKAAEFEKYREKLDNYYNSKLTPSHKQMIQKILDGKPWGDDAIA